VFKRFCRIALLAMSIAISIPVLNVHAEDQNWQVNLKDADISAFISQIADITGKSFVIDPRVKGKVTVVSTETMNTEAVYELFLSVLKVHGYAAVPAGDVIMVVQQNSVKQQGRDLEAKFSKQSQEMITKVIMIKNTPALDLVPILRPLVAKYGHLAGVKSANGLIISDHASNITRIEQIIDRLDKSGSEELEVIQLKEAWVGNVVTMLQSLDPDKVAQGKGSKRAYS
jgi:general secretion pathway protein D